MKSTADCDYTRPGVEPWWECHPVAQGEELGMGSAHAA